MEDIKVKVEKSIIDVFDIDVDSLELHELAKLTPRMNELDYQALKKDIEVNGQRDPGVLFRGKVIDGRHRLWILSALGHKTMKFTKMPSNSSKAELVALVKSKETRRHDTTAQKAIMAFNYINSSDEQVTQKEAAELYGVSVKRVIEAKKIVVQYGRRDILDLLFAGNKFNVGTVEVPFMTDSLGTIIKWLEKYGVAAKTEKQIDLDRDEELTDDEELWLTKLVALVGKEREAVRKTAARRLYSTLNQVVEES